MSKTGVFCTLYEGVAQVNSGQGIGSVSKTVSLLRQRRRGMVSSKEEYLYCHTALLYYAQDILVKRMSDIGTEYTECQSAVCSMGVC